MPTPVWQWSAVETAAAIGDEFASANQLLHVISRIFAASHRLALRAPPCSAYAPAGAPTGRRVIVSMITAPASSRPPANRNALVKLPVAATM
jgi:hypothetical protein